MRVAHDATLTEWSASASAESPMATQPLGADSAPCRVVTFLSSAGGLLVTHDTHGVGSVVAADAHG